MQLEPRLVKTLRVDKEGELFTLHFVLYGGEQISVDLGRSGIWTLTQGLTDAVVGNLYKPTPVREGKITHRLQPAIQPRCVDECGKPVSSPGRRCMKCAAAERHRVRRLPLVSVMHG